MPSPGFQNCEHNIEFSVCTNDQLQPHQIISSTADIYFDNLDPISTRYEERIPDDDCSSAISCDQGQPDPMLLMVSPNPFTTHFLIDYEVPPAGGHVQIQLFDIYNQPIGPPVIDNWHIGGTYNFFQDASYMAPGLYYLSAMIDGEIQTLQLLKM